MSHVLLHSDPMANFGMIRQTAANLRSEGQYSLIVPGKARCVFAGRLLFRCSKRLQKKY